MWNIPNNERLDKIPKLYQTENIPLRDKLIYLHFFIGGCDWYVAEFDVKDLFFGFAILNNDIQNSEWGYISFEELKQLELDGWLEVDCETEEAWKIRKASEVEKIRIAHGWAKKESNTDALTKEQKLLLKVRAGHFQHFQDLFAEVTSPYSDFFGVDPYPIWKRAQKQNSDDRRKIII
jgi:hypothetical protein